MEWDDKELPENCLNYLANEWKDIAENENKKDWRDIITKNSTLLSEQEKEIYENSRKNNLARDNSQFDDLTGRHKEGDNPYG